MPRDNYTQKQQSSKTTKQVKLLGASVTINSQAISVNLRDSAGLVLHCSGAVTVTDGGAGYAKGCLYIKTDAADGTSGLYVNVGTTAACNFDLVTDA